MVKNIKPNFTISKTQKVPIVFTFKEGELDENSNMHFLHNTQYKYRPTKVYSLDVIISVGPVMTTAKVIRLNQGARISASPLTLMVTSVTCGTCPL